MASPIIQQVFPSNEATAVPVGAQIAITLDKSVDLKSAKDNIVIYGADFDMLSGPETATWLHQGDINNPMFLRSPGFKGVVDYDLSAIYVDPDSGEEIEVTDVISPSVEEYANAYYKLLLTPKNLLSEKTEFKVFIVGENEDNLKKGISKRTVYECNSSSASSEDGEVFLFGGYDGTVDDILNVEITSSGNIGLAEYKYWFKSDGVSSATTGRLTSRRFRKLKRSTQIRFSGSKFIKGDTYTFEVYKKEFIEDSYTFSFTTSSSFIEEVPDTMATSPIGTKVVLSNTAGSLTLLDMDPEDGGTNLTFSDNTIVLSFDNDIDSDTVTDDTVAVYAYPVSGFYSGNNSLQEPKILRKKLTVSNNKIIIEV